MTKLPKFSRVVWNIIILFWVSWFATAGYLLICGEESASTRFAFVLCGELALLAESKGGGCGYLGKKFILSIKRFQSWIICIVLIGLLVALFKPVFDAGYSKARAVSSLSALKRYGLAVAGYSREHDGCLPEKVGKAKMYVQLAPYVNPLVHDPTPKVDPVPNVDPASGKPFIWRRSLGGVRVSEIKNPDKVILAYSPSYEDMHSKYRSVLFLDGHVKRYPESAFWEVWRKQPELPARPKRGKVGTQPVH